MNAKPDQLDATLGPLGAADEDRLAQILDDYLRAAEQGTPISPQELLAQHPADADRLRGYLSGLQLFHQAAAGSSRSSRGRSLLGPRVQANDTIGDFRLVCEIGRGGMGVVYEAEQISLRRRVALKILPFTVGHDEKQIIRFKNEAQAAAQIKHPHIVPVYAVGEEHGVHFYAMQLIEGHSLSTRLAGEQATAAGSTVGSTAPMHATATHGNRKSTAPTVAPQHTTTSGATQRHVREIASLGVQAAEALDAAHEYGIVHRDVKPSNLLVDGDGKLWVTDFGLARCRENDGLTRTGDVLGTMRYMSPEQALGRGVLVDHRTDIYSLGVTLYELSTLHHPAGDVTDAQLLVDRRRFTSKPLQHWNRHIPVDFQTIVLKAIAEFPGERYGTARELADDLNRFLEGKPILASPPSLATLAGKWITRHRRVVTAAAAVLILAFVGQFANMLLLASQKHETERALVASNENFRRAHEVLDRFGTRYAEQLAAIPGAEGVRAQMLEGSLAFYEQFEKLSADDPTLAGDLALAYNRMGTLSEKLGDSQRALTHHLAARRIWQERLAADPENTETTRNLALCENNLGQMQAELGETSAAVASLRHAQKLQRELSAKDPNSRPLATELATTCNNLGLVLRELGQRQAAIDAFTAAIDEQHSIATRSTKDEAALRVLAASHNNLGSLVDGSHAEEAAKHYHQAIAIQRQLVEANPINRLYQGDLARTYNNLGFVLARRRDWQNAELCYLDAIKLQQHLVEQAPLAGSYTRDLAISFNNLGMVQSRDARFAAAEESFEHSIKLQRRLLAAMPSDARTLSNLGGAYNNLGLLFDAQRRSADAEAAYESAIDFQKQALAAAPENGRYRELLSNHYANFAKCLTQQKKQEAAERIVAERTSLLAGWTGRVAE